MKAKLTILGSGTSSGIPMIGCSCPVCSSTDPRDSRLRASALVEYGGLTILIDCGPDFRQQALRAGLRHLDAILLTHNHMDHVGGLDDTRALNLCESHPVNIYCEKYVEDSLRHTYAYAFAEPKYQGAPEWHMHTIDAGGPFKVWSNAGDEVLQWEKGFGYRHLENKGSAGKYVEVTPIQGWHHKTKKLSVLGYRFDDIAYLTDMNLIDDCETAKLKGLRAVTINCVKPGPHHSHFSLDEALEFFEKVGAEESYITHLSHLLPPHAEFEKQLPPHVHPAYDGLII
ncbi:MAG: MBL fold metallo-hydrolase [Bacteroidales bacterium]|nr:MBL fold metallo-hydrolase [Bacteroidales bacterium]